MLEILAADDAAVGRVAQLATAIAAALRRGGKVLACGNGGSCCDAMHFCEELTGRFRTERPPLAAIACTDAGHITCTANDFGYEHVFARWVEALGRPGDVLIVLSTSGNSKNVLRAIEAGERAQCEVAALLGGDGGAAAGRGRWEWIVPGRGSDRIQELHMLILHLLVEQVERELGAGG